MNRRWHICNLYGNILKNVMYKRYKHWMIVWFVQLANNHKRYSRARSLKFFASFFVLNSTRSLSFAFGAVLQCTCRKIAPYQRQRREYAYRSLVFPCFCSDILHRKTTRQSIEETRTYTYMHYVLL